MKLYHIHMDRHMYHNDGNMDKFLPKIIRYLIMSKLYRILLLFWRFLRLLQHQELSLLMLGNYPKELTRVAFCHFYNFPSQPQYYLHFSVLQSFDVYSFGQVTGLTAGFPPQNCTRQLPIIQLTHLKRSIVSSSRSHSLTASRY